MNRRSFVGWLATALAAPAAVVTAARERFLPMGEWKGLIVKVSPRQGSSLADFEVFAGTDRLLSSEIDLDELPDLPHLWVNNENVGPISLTEPTEYEFPGYAREA